MKEERYLKDREAIVRADIWKEITSSCKGLRTELGYTNILWSFSPGESYL